MNEARKEAKGKAELYGLSFYIFDGYVYIRDCGKPGVYGSPSRRASALERDLWNSLP